MPDQNFKSIFQSIWRIEKAVLETLDFEESTKRVVNIILTELGYINTGYEIIVLSLLDEKKGELRRIAISRTKAAENFLNSTPIPFKDIVIPLSATNNLSVRAINERKAFTTENVHEVLVPALSKEWVDNFQQVLKIKTTLVYPIIAKDKVLGSLIFSLSKGRENISEEEWAILDSFVGAVGIGLDNALLFKALNETSFKLLEANERLKQVDHLKDEFVSLASHELRTPMTVIKSYIWMLLYNKNKQLDPKEKMYLERAYSSTERLIKLVNDMLNVSRIESGRLKLEMKDFDIVKLVSTIVTELGPRAQELGLKLTLEKPNIESKILNGDSDRVEQILINLIGNSLKFTPPGGSIKVGLVASEKEVLISISDTGKGIKPEDMHKLFQKFGTMGTAYLQKNINQGSGLGLYLSKSLVELHGGRIHVESAGENKGSTFSFTLPYNQDKPHQEAEVLPATSANSVVTSVPAGLGAAPVVGSGVPPGVK